MTSGYFITGTDTGCGKTEITLGLMKMLQDQGFSTLGMKPVASGAVQTSEGLRNDDAVRIQQQGSEPLHYDLVNPFAYEPPIAPHLAAEQFAHPITFERIIACYESIKERSDTVLVEGVGGWRVPLGKKQFVSDLAMQLKLPVIYVVGLRLGCINHALLTAEAIKESGLELAGWVANVVDPDMLEPEGTLEVLRDLLPGFFLGYVPWLDHPSTATVASYLSPVRG